MAIENIETYDAVEECCNCDFTPQYKGDSMINARILDGDIVCVHQQAMVENGEITAIIIEGEATLKRFYRFGDTVLLRAEDPKRWLITANPPINQDGKILRSANTHVSNAQTHKNKCVNAFDAVNEMSERACSSFRAAKKDLFFRVSKG